MAEGGQLLVRRELGGRWAIDFDPAVDLEIGMPGRIVGTIVAKGVLALERFTPDVWWFLGSVAAGSHSIGLRRQPEHW